MNVVISLVFEVLGALASVATVVGFTWSGGRSISVNG